MKKTIIKKIVIIGGGAIGCACAYIISKNKNFNITVLEKNNDFLSGKNQSTRNSGVIHSGIYYDKEIMPLKAMLCPKGNALLYEFCKNYNVPHKKTGKIVVVTNDIEKEFLDYFFDIAKENGIEVKKLSATETKKIQPNVNAVSSLFVPSSGVISPIRLLEKLISEGKKQGVLFEPGSSVVKIEAGKDNKKNKFEVQCNSRTYEADFVINAAGLYADEISKIISPENAYLIEPTRGESAAFNITRKELEVKMNIYPVPAPYFADTGKSFFGNSMEFRSLLKKGEIKFTTGIHLSPTFGDDGEISNLVTIGPAKTLFLEKEDYESEKKQTPYYYEGIKKYFPLIRPEEIKLYNTGIMAVPASKQDWIIELDKKYKNCLHLVGIDSPGLTSSLAIAEYAAGMLNLREKETK